MKKPVIITIDGPAGAGKSSIAKLLARRLRFHYLDTGALYRAITLKAIKEGIKFSDKKSITDLISRTQLKIIYPSHEKNSYRGKEKILMDGNDVSKEIRIPQLSAKVSKISSFSLIRKSMVKLQRKFAKAKNIVCEGRDMGSVVFPKAQIKFYLDASIKERAKRRYTESCLLFPGNRLTYNRILNEISKRDYQDIHRKTAPLIRPRGSFYLDTTNLSKIQALNRLIKVVKEKIGKK